MSRNLQGFFAGLNDCTQYSVKIISNHESDEFEEIFLSADRPFVVSYDTNNTPFEPIRYSRASINVVADEKFFDVFSSTAQGTKVILTNETTETIEWVGYLTSNLISMPDVSCDVETFTLEANDCISTLDKYDYQGWTSAKTIVTFSQLLAGIANRCGQITDLFVDMSLMRENNTYVTMDDLTISEQNFYSSDTDEPWNVQDVLIELCKYLGYTAMQKGTSLYLVDLQAHTNQKWNGDEATLYFNFYHYKQENQWASFIQEVVEVPALTLRQSIIMGTGADISLETLYNKIQVKDSFYEIDNFIPDIYADSHLTNREGDFWKCNQIAPGNYHLNYMGKNGKVKSEEKPESDHIYYIRKFDHDWYDYIYRDLTTLEEVEVTGFTASGISVSSVEANAGSSGDTGQFYELNAVFTNNDPISHNVAVTVGIGAAWYQPPYTTMRTDESERVYNFTIASGETYTGSFSAACSAGQNTLMLVYINHMNIDGGPDIEIQGGYSSLEMKYVSPCIVDLATFDKPMDTSKYLYETESDISFERYIMIHQHDQPYRMHPHSQWLFEDMMTPLHDYEIEAVFPELMRLSSGYTNPMIIDNKAYLALNAEAIYERYELEYKNPEWTDENTRRSFLGLFGPVHGITTIAPCLIFKLKIGDKYWSSELNQWTTTEGCFVVNLGVDKADKDDVDFTAWWNKEHPVLNNLSWSEWGGLSGYKIPLDETLDFSQPIEFSMMMPSKMQKIDGDNTLQYNEMCWVKDLGIEFTTKDSENYSNADVLYENIIDSGSVNTLSDISCRFTTYPGEGMHSYSNVGMDGKLINQIVRLGLDNIPNKAEENIIKSYSNMYSSPTIKENLTINLDANQMSRIYDPTILRYFMVLGGEIDYSMGSQRLSIVQSKMWGEEPPVPVGPLTGLTMNAIWKVNMPHDGGVATYENCDVQIIARYKYGASADVTSSVTISGSQIVPSTSEESTHSAGTLTLETTYSGISVEQDVVIYQNGLIPEVPLTFEMLEDGTIEFYVLSSDFSKTISYSKDSGENWTTITSSEGNTSIPVSNGDVVWFKGYNSTYYSRPCENTLRSTARHNIYGDLSSLLLNNTPEDRYFQGLFRDSTGLISAEGLIIPATMKYYCLSNLFYGCTNLKEIPVLPAAILAEGCYGNMFRECTSLTTAPLLPATTLANYCYTSMFEGCDSLETTPSLPATTLANYCYWNMFKGCESLTTAPELPASSLTELCYASMFEGCTSLETTPSLPATTLARACYQNMFKGCESLKNVPYELPAQNVGVSYDSMFAYCTSLETAPILSSTISPDYRYMFEGCTSLKNVQSALPATTLLQACYAGMFKGCTSLTTAPELPADMLEYNCYKEMFSGCTSLIYVKCLATKGLQIIGYKDNWLADVSPTGTFVKSSQATDWPSGAFNGIPEGWTIIDA